MSLAYFFCQVISIFSHWLIASRWSPHLKIFNLILSFSNKVIHILRIRAWAYLWMLPFNPFRGGLGEALVPQHYFQISVFLLFCTKPLLIWNILCNFVLLLFALTCIIPLFLTCVCMDKLISIQFLNLFLTSLLSHLLLIWANPHLCLSWGSLWFQVCFLTSLPLIVIFKFNMSRCISRSYIHLPYPHVLFNNPET